MKRLLFTLAVGALLCTSCQNELYSDPSKDFGSDQGAYIDAKGPVQIFVSEGEEYHIKDIRVGLSLKENSLNEVTIEAGNAEQLAAYNKKNGTSYLMLPKEMYTVPESLSFKPTVSKLSIPITLKDIKFSMEGDYALPIKIIDGGVNVIPGEDEGIVILEKLTRTKVLKMPMTDGESGSDKMFPDDFKVNQWTLEFMIKRSAYVSKNMAIGGTKLIANSGPHDEIYTRFGDVTISPNQLQIKTGSSQIDVAKDRFAAEPNKWYMISFVYDGKNTLIYINGDLVADREIRDGAYGLVGFWISKKNEFIREVRFWDVARSQQQVKSYVWKMVNPDEKGLLLYYPCNGKKRNLETGEITEDETMIWNWASYYDGDKSKLNLPKEGVFDDNGGELYTFPLQD